MPGDQDDEMAYTATNRHTDRHTIIEMNLRTVRFIVVVVVGLGTLFAFAALTVRGHTLATTESKSEADEIREAYNALFGTIMYATSKVVELYIESLILPTIHTYLHNTPMFPGDQPHRATSQVKASCIFWGLKTILIFMNVGFASLYVGQREVVTPSAVSRSLQEMETSTSDLYDTVLRSFLAPNPFDKTSPLGICPGQSADSMEMDELTVPVVKAGFPKRSWNELTFPFGIEPSKHSNYLYAGNSYDLERRMAQDGWNTSTVDELIEQGLRYYRQDAETNLTGPMSMRLISLAQAVALNTTRGSGKVSLRHLNVSDHIQLDILHLRIPVELEPDVRRFCGQRACLTHFPVEEFKEQLRIHAYATQCQADHIESCLVDPSAALLIGSGAITEVTETTSPVNTSASLVLAKLSWKPSPLNGEYSSHWKDRSAFFQEELCIPLQKASRENLCVALKSIPRAWKQSVAGHLLLRILPGASPAPWVVFPLSDPLRRADGPSRECIVDAYAHHIQQNHLQMQDPEQALYTSALWYLFQHASLSRSTAFAPRHRLLSASDPIERKGVILEIPTSSAIATFVGCGCMLLLMVCVIWLPTARVRLTPDTTAAAQYVQILTDDLYPDIVHKKRLRFPNGDKLDFNQYVVDAIVLRAKRDRSKAVWLA